MASGHGKWRSWFWSFLSQQQSYTDLWFKGGRFQQRRAAIWAFLWPGGAHTEEFRSLPTGSSTGSSTISNFVQICIRVLKGYSTQRDAVDDTQEILNQLGTHCNTGENEQFLFPRVRRNYPTRAVAYYANSIAARRIILSGDVVVNPGPTKGTESQGALQNKQNRARPKSNWLIRLNCRSLLQNIDEMGLIFTCNRPFMIAVTETWLNNTISNDEIHIQGW